VWSVTPGGRVQLGSVLRWWAAPADCLCRALVCSTSTVGVLQGAAATTLPALGSVQVEGRLRHACAVQPFGWGLSRERMSTPSAPANAVCRVCATVCATAPRML
jgi:hypothetical protein